MRWDKKENNHILIIQSTRLRKILSLPEAQGLLARMLYVYSLINIPNIG
jgi:hypothetical protein